MFLLERKTRITRLFKGKLIFLEFFFLTILFYGCSVYTPQIAPPVQIEKKGEIQVDGSLSLSSYFVVPGIHASIAYGLTDHLSLQASANAIYKSNNQYDGSLSYNRRINNYLKLGLYTGYSYGTIFLTEKHQSFGSEPWYYDWSGNYQIPYLRLQSIIDIYYVSLGLGCKFGWFIPNIALGDNLHYSDQGFIIEPCITLMPINLGINLVCTLNYSYSKIFIASYNTSSILPSYNTNGILSIGLNYRFNPQIKHRD